MTIRELLDRFRSVVDESASETAKDIGDFLDVLFLKLTGWMPTGFTSCRPLLFTLIWVLD